MTRLWPCLHDHCCASQVCLLGWPRRAVVQVVNQVWTLQAPGTLPNVASDKLSLCQVELPGRRLVIWRTFRYRKVGWEMVLTLHLWLRTRSSLRTLRWPPRTLAWTHMFISWRRKVQLDFLWPFWLHDFPPWLPACSVFPPPSPWTPPTEMHILWPSYFYPPHFFTGCILLRWSCTIFDISLGS